MKIKIEWTKIQESFRCKVVVQILLGRSLIFEEFFGREDAEDRYAIEPQCKDKDAECEIFYWKLFFVNHNWLKGSFNRKTLVLFQEITSNFNTSDRVQNPAEVSYTAKNDCTNLLRM